MTKEEKIKAFEMRLDGLSFQAIADEMGYTRQNIQQTLKNSTTKKPITKVVKYCGIAKWMDANAVRVEDFAEMLDIKSRTLYNYLRRERKMTEPIIRKILKVTGLTFEEAFEINEGE